MRWVSTLRSSHRGEPSRLAILETILAVGVSTWAAVHYRFLGHIAVSAVLASLLLFRTRRSDRICLGWFSRAVDRSTDWLVRTSLKVFERLRRWKGLRWGLLYELVFV